MSEELIARTVVPAGRFYGPCSGNDLPLAFKLFGDSVDRFTFCDLIYRGSRVTAREAVPECWKLVYRVCGLDETAVEKLAPSPRGRLIRPWMTVETWRRPNGSEVLVELRRDLAQDVLIDQFAPGSIAAFMHVNDSPGEGGSNIWFLAPPSEDVGDAGPKLSLLAETVSRLRVGGIVVTDAGLAAPGFRSDTPFELAGRRWELVGSIPNDRRPAWPLRVWRCLEIA